MSDPTPSVSTPLAATIYKVIVLEDRAQVFRRGKIALGVGTHRLTVSGVTALVDDRSAVAKAGDGTRVDSVRVQRRWHFAHDKSGPEHDALRERAIAYARALDALDRQRQSESRQSDLLNHATDLALQGLNRELHEEMPFADRWPHVLHRLFAARHRQDEARLALQGKADELERERLAIAGRAEGLSSHPVLARADIELTISCDSAREVQLEVSYVVPCAAWRPLHRAHALKTGVTIESSAAVWQASGEDWNEIELWVSTARPTRPAAPPALPVDTVHKRQKLEKKTVVAIRQTTIQSTGAGAQEDADLPGVDDGGETRLLRAAGLVSIPSDGKMRRSPLFSFDAPAEWKALCRPELDVTVHPVCTTSHRGSSPLLPGPVDLIGESGFVGRGQLEFVAPGEKFELDLGASEHLRVKRWTDEKRETARLTGKQTITREVRLYISNLDGTARDFTIEERIPVSELQDVQVELFNVEKFAHAKPDEFGVLRCPIKLQPHAVQEVSYSYRLVAAASVQGL